jgi:hypothetical protein
MRSIGAASLFIDIRPRDVSDAGHLPSANHICVPVSQADVEAKISLPAITERAAQRLFATAHRARFAIVVYGQVCDQTNPSSSPIPHSSLCMCNAMLNRIAKQQSLI